MDHSRNEICAYVGPNLSAEGEYQKYQIGISQKIEEMLHQGNNSLAFLFDIHGTDDERAPNGHFIDAIVGTDQTRSRQALTDDYFWGDSGLIPLLETKGIRAYPENLNQERAIHETVDTP